jgi:hypothetical protein
MEPCHLVSCFAAIMMLYLFNSCVKFLSAPALKGPLTFHVARFQSFLLFCELLRFPGHGHRLGRLVASGFSTGNVFTKVGVSAPHSNSPPGGPGTPLLGLPFLSRDDPALRPQTIVFTRPLLGL